MDARHTAIRRGTFFLERDAVSETAAAEGAARKVTLREELTARRKALTPDIIDTRGLKVQARFLATPYYQRRSAS